MEHLSIFFFSLCCFVLAKSTPTDSSTTTEISKSNGCDARNVIEKPHADILNDAECSLVNQRSVKGTVQIREQSGLYLNKISDASTIPTVSSFSDSYTKHVQYTKRIENREDDASPSNHKDRSNVDLSLHDIPLDPSDVILARPTRQDEKSNIAYSNPSSIENTNIASDIENESIDSSQGSSDLEGDLGVAEDRYRFQYPYWYRRQFANPRYQAYNRREPYRNYLRYPVFPGK
ncbi:uncharacterized protein [Anoplolepis gracilipes]|uniref:uncharacterized protein n=1 Tax=Anoplolepis gracilipes TaxID=354296 RepID=UPI003BA28CFB